MNYIYGLPLDLGSSGGTSVTVTPGAGSVVVSGFAPSVAAGASVSLGSGSVVLTGHAPGASGSAAASPGVGAVVVRGYAPEVTEPEEVAHGGAADRRKKKKRKPVARVLKSLGELSEVTEVYESRAELEPVAVPEFRDLVRRLDADRAESDRIRAEVAASAAARQAEADAAARDHIARRVAANAAEAARLAEAAEVQRRAEFESAVGARYRSMKQAWDDLVRRKMDEDEDEVEQLALGVW